MSEDVLINKVLKMSKDRSDDVMRPGIENVSRLGFWSAVLSAVFAIAYIVAEIAHLLGLLGPHGSPLSLILRMVPSLLLAPSFVVLMVSIHHYASEEKKIWSHVGLAFAIIYAVLVSVIYFVEMTVVVPPLQRGESDKVALLIFDPFTSFMYAIDVLGYGFMSLATLFVAPVFAGRKLERWIRRA